MIERVATTIRRYQMFEAGQSVGVAVSGGADSVCLLYILRELAPRWNLRLRVLHLNHGLRGADADGDAEFVHRLAEEFGFRFTLRHAALAEAEGNLEEAAREARLAFYQAEQASGAVDRIAVGHTRSDQAETVLFRFLRGAGTAGLAGIRPVTASGIVRPLIAVERAEVEQYLREHSIAWREDTTNQSHDFARNRIRHHLLPSLMREWNPALPQTLTHTADWALAEESYWDSEITRLAASHLQPKKGRILVETGALNRLPLAAARRLVRRAMETVRGDLRAVDFAHVNAVLELAASTEGHGRLQVPGVDIIRSFNWLSFAIIEKGRPARQYEFPLTLPCAIPIPGEDFAITIEVIDNKTASSACNSIYNEPMVCVDCDRLAGPLTLRNWRPGDQYHPLGSAGEQKIKSLFQEFRIPLWERRHWPVLVDGNSIVWARRFGPDQRVTPRTGTRKLLRLQETGIGNATWASNNEEKGR